MYEQKRVAAIHDISGFGKCSLTVALPILSAAGLECCAMPTAVLSTHTGGLHGFTYRDLTGDLLPFANHWQSLHLHFDALYSGFLGSFEQIGLVSQIFDLLKSNDTLILVDPCMADNGSYYQVYSGEMAAGMASLCQKADIIVPNLTEAAFLLGEDYREGPYDRDYIEAILRRLSKEICPCVVLTGVWFDNATLGAACIKDGAVCYAMGRRIEGAFHGTGDIFASVLLSMLLKGIDLQRAAQAAVDFVEKSIERTSVIGTDPRFGVQFEPFLSLLTK